MKIRIFPFGLTASMLIFCGWSLPKINNPIDSISDSISSSFSSEEQEEEISPAASFSGDYAAEISKIDEEIEENGDGRDGLLLYVEQGTIYRAASGSETAVAPSDPEEDISSQEYFLTRSIEALDQAEALVNSYEQEGNLRITQEGLALFTNQANRDYEGRSYDKVMINTYKALNYMALGNFDAARVELNRSLQRQRDAVEANAERIEAAQQALEEEDADKVDRAREDEATNTALQAIEQEVDSRILAYGVYVNPLAVFLDGLYFLYAGQDASDLERARKSLERVAGMVPDNTYIRDDLAAAEAAKPRENVTYVIFETGRAPSRDEEKIEIPTFLVLSDISYVGASFPKLVYNEDFDQTLTVSSEGLSMETSTLSSMDSVISEEFKNEWPWVMRATIASSLAKAGTDAGIQSVASNSFGFAGQLVTRVTTAGVQSKLNKADTRTWETLPKEFQYVCVPTPSSGILVLSTGSESRSVPVAPGEVNVVYVKSDAASSPLLVSQFTFSSVLP